LVDVYPSLTSKLCANVCDLLHQTRAMQQHVVLQEELIDHILDSGMAL
jgi:hypothetical protein